MVFGCRKIRNHCSSVYDIIKAVLTELGESNVDYSLTRQKHTEMKEKNW